LVHSLTRLRQRAYIDAGPAEATVFVSGMGRSGTTWLADLINHRFDHRVLFEPFRADIVPDAGLFGGFAYMRPANSDAARRTAAERILSGRTPRGPVDRQHRGLVFRRRIVKDVRTNLMLGWLKTLRPQMPLVVIVRHPFAVAASWQRLDWGKVADGSTRELDVILGHGELHEDFPIVADAMRHVDRSSVFECAVAEWCVLHLVPLAQLAPSSARFVHFEALVAEPERTFLPLAMYLGIDVDEAALERVFNTSSFTDSLNRGQQVNREQRLANWKKDVSPAQADRGNEILASFGLGEIYDGDGRPLGLPSLPTRP
jgi:hypothetical protein